jgi:uncharacterized protein (DUF1800 family)
MRRAGFGASRDELESRAKKGYEATVEELIDPDAHGVPKVDIFKLYRYHPMTEVPPNPSSAQMNLIFQFIRTQRPLEEKMMLFWHMLFATGNSKVDSPPDMIKQMEILRSKGLGNYKELLLEISKNPAMLFWLDNNQNHRTAPNENWGRELLELFSMGQGHYSEDDVKMAARAFTGWTMKPKLPRSPYMRGTWEFEYHAEDHDDGPKTFLGRSGNFNGEDIIDIIAEEPATARFIARHLYNFFVEDDVQVPSWLDVPAKNPGAVDAIAKTLKDSDFDIKSTLRFLFNADFFKDEKVWFAKVKNPVELVVGVSRLVGEYQERTKPGLVQTAIEPGYQGQEIVNPPSVEGWHYGSEWIDTGSLVRRVNYAAAKLGDTSYPGVRSIIDKLSIKPSMKAEELLDGCLELLGVIRLESGTRKQLIEHVEAAGPLKRGSTDSERRAFATRVSELLQLIGSTREYQFC